MTSTDFETIVYSAADRVARITLNRPEKRNALDLRLRSELVDALRLAEEDDDVAVVLLDANGPSFSSGYDMTQRPVTEPPRGWIRSAHFDRWTDQFARSCLRDWLVIWDLLKPVVAKVHGHCLAGATELMSMCDIAFVADDAVIGYPPMRGMSTPDVPFFPWKLSMAHAKYLQLSGNCVTGREAAEMGWVAKSFPAAELEAGVAREVRALAAIAPDLLAANKGALNQAYEAMGMRANLQSAWQWHALSAAFRPGAGDFSAAVERGGLRAGLAWRDGAANREGFVP
jgi:enoyl-CoA hydratase